jgi:hypothetical protein
MGSKSLVRRQTVERSKAREQAPAFGHASARASRATARATLRETEAERRSAKCVRSALPFVRGLPAQLRLPPPNDESRAVVAFAARAVCADRATFRGPQRRSTRVRLPSSFVSLSQSHPDDVPSTIRSCRGWATFIGTANRHYSGAHCAPTQLQTTRTKWHTR